MDFLGHLLLTMGMLLVLSVIVTLVFYVLGSIGLYKLAKRLDDPLAWQAWVPYLRELLIGRLSGAKLWGAISAGAMLFSTIVTICFTLSTGVSNFLTYAVSAILAISATFLWARVSTKATAMGILSVFLPLRDIFFFATRNNPIKEIEIIKPAEPIELSDIVDYEANDSNNS